MLAHTTTTPILSPRPGRFAATFRDHPTGCRAALLGLPDDTGVYLNGGRPGACQGPAAFRAALARFGTTHDAVARADLDPVVWNAGSVVPIIDTERPENAVLDTHDRATEAAQGIHEKGLISIAVGGGHDLTRPTVRALSQHAGGPVGGINLDAHLDVRPAIGSGMPYRALIDESYLDGPRFVELGIGRHTCDADHIAYLDEHGATIIDIETTLTDADGAIERALFLALPDEAAGFVSIDLDAIDATQAPGVSAPNPMGVPVSTAVSLAQAAGAHPGVRHFDIMELNPTFDIDGRTARVAALLFMSFIAGLRERPTA